MGESNLDNWTQAVAAHGSQAFDPLSQRTDVEAELRRLREEVRILRMEKDIFIKLVSTFRGEDHFFWPPASL